MISDAKAVFEEWISAVAGAVESLIGRYAPRPQIELAGESTAVLTARLKSARKGPQLPDVSFRISNGRPTPPLSPDWQAAFRGSRVETQLVPAHVLFRPLDFPKQATDFLDGMIRTQIDRLTPWSAEEAAFGWSAPSPSGQERIELTLAATSKQEIEPLVQFASGLGAQSLTAFAVPPAGNGQEKIKVLDQSLRGAAFHGLDTPRTLRVVLLSAAGAVAILLLAGLYFGDSLDSEQQQLVQRISQRRAALRLGPDGGSAVGLLAKRKQSSPSTVIVLEALSKALPDGTYVTELRIDGDKVQVVGMTQDAPSLIRLIEKSPQFARATFFAPTTRAQNAPGEQFHIEARITPSFGSST
ncbi:PilN domain-containing protein [Bradyrhizobium erythrophlei]|jgi:general secretion pathway protein L|uniref:General secretion pathway protein L n=1 Tax=Bradyrhizobium erythrophlei TaxID=1437360 RepID=A0A1M7T2E6_9BRAD|nr:PilN domain-containing protein [Bradyrhizobium erythrophlei]SHN64881.1 general secretion pathway protein L [Bradyrhizobium erythrophlei]